MKGLKYNICLHNGLTFNICGFTEEMARSNFKMHFPQYANENIYPIWYVYNTGEMA
jgi:hypothetical protein